jgi:hypothetical protein
MSKRYMIFASLFLFLDSSPIVPHACVICSFKLGDEVVTMAHQLMPLTGVRLFYMLRSVLFNSPELKKNDFSALPKVLHDTFYHMVQRNFIVIT